MPSAASQDRTLKIVSCRQVYSGKNQLGHEYTIYEVEAAGQDGRLINEKLRAFRALPIGQVVEVTIEPFHSEQHGKSFTLHPKQSTSPGGAAQLNEAKELLGKLEARVSALEEDTTRLKQEITRLQGQKPPAAGGPATW